MGYCTNPPVTGVVTSKTGARANSDAKESSALQNFATILTTQVRNKIDGISKPRFCHKHKKKQRKAKDTLTESPDLM